MKKIKILLGVMILVTFVLEAVNIYISNSVSTDSIYASSLQDEIKDMEAKNSSLKGEILSYASYEMISSRSSELGFVEPKDFISLYSPVPLAIKNEN